MNLDSKTLLNFRPSRDIQPINGNEFDGPNIDNKCNPVTCRLIIFFTDNLMPFFMNNIIDIGSQIKPRLRLIPVAAAKPTTGPLDPIAAKPTTGPLDPIAAKPTTGPLDPIAAKPTTGPLDPIAAKPTTGPLDPIAAKPTTGPLDPVTAKPTTGPLDPVTAKPTTGPLDPVTAKPTTGPLDPITAKPTTGPLDPVGGAKPTTGPLDPVAAGVAEPEPVSKKYMIVICDYTHEKEGMNIMDLTKGERLEFIKQDAPGGWIYGKRGEKYGWVHPSCVMIEPTADEKNKIIILTFTCMFNFIFYHLYQLYSEKEQAWVIQQINTILIKLPHGYHDMFEKCICISFKNLEVKMRESETFKYCNFIIKITDSKHQVKLLDEFKKVMKRCLPFWKIKDPIDDGTINQETNINMRSSTYINNKYIFLQPISINVSLINYIPKKSNYMKDFIEKYLYVKMNKLFQMLFSNNSFAEIYQEISIQIKSKVVPTEDIKLSLFHFLLFLIFLKVKYPEIDKKINFYPETYDEYYTLFSNISQNTIDEICNNCESFKLPREKMYSSLIPLGPKKIYLDPPKFLLPIESPLHINIIDNSTFIEGILNPTKGGSLPIPINIKNAHDNVNLPQIKPSTNYDLKVKKHKKTIKQKLLKKSKKTIRNMK
jgi:hypothetical protein